MRVALLSYRGNPYSGGQGVYVRHLSRGLRDLGHDVTVISGPPYATTDEGVRLVRLPALDLYAQMPPDRRAWRRIRRPSDLVEYGTASTGRFGEPLAFGLRAAHYLARHADRFDIVHDNQSLSYPLLGVQRRGLPVVATVHHPIHIDRACALQEAADHRERTRIRRWYSFLAMQGRVARRVRGVITVSESAKQETQRAFRLRRPLDVVYNGVDSGRFRQTAQPACAPRRVVVVTSADQPIKGLRQLYGVIERVLAARQPGSTEITIVGAPSDAEATAREFRRRGFNGAVRFLGKLSEAELVDAYSTATVAVIPSRYEGFGLPAAEALSCGVPVVAFDAGALPEVLGADGTTGRIVPALDEAAMAEAIVELLDDPVHAAHLGDAGRRRVLECFSWRRAACETAAVYERVLSGAHR